MEEVWGAGYFHQESRVSCVKRSKVSKSNSGVSCACLTCITDNYPVIYNQQACVHWGKNRNGYFTKYIGFTYSLGKIIRKLIRSYDSLLYCRGANQVFLPPPSLWSNCGLDTSAETVMLTKILVSI